MEEKAFITLLSAINVLNYDNGKKFSKTARLDKIGELLWNTDYRRVNAQGLFHLYAKKPVKHLNRAPVVISSHIDCHKNITRCFADEEGETYLRGTFDNSATNAAVLALMLENRLPDHVIVAFTGDEEDDSKGARQVIKFLKQQEKAADAVIVLDVTDMGWQEKCDFTIENDFIRPSTGESLIKTAAHAAGNWLFVPSNPSNIPPYVPADRVIRFEAEPDESWEYDEANCNCFSLCIPVHGNMHSNEGVLLRKASIPVYCSLLEQLATVL